MKIEVLYFDGCPNHETTLQLVREVADELGVDAEVRKVELTDPDQAVEYEFLGSPSVRVDGLDIEPGARSRSDFGFACRTYSGSGMPSRDMVVAAIRGEATDAPASPGLLVPGLPGAWASGGTVVAAVVASACCWLPLLMLTTGLSAGGLGAAFAQTRTLFFGLAAMLLAVGFYYAYIRKEECEEGSACETPNPKLRRVNRVSFWFAAAGLLVFGLFPNYLSVLAEADAVTPPVETAAASATVALGVEGMSCEGCATHVKKALSDVPGVLDVLVDYSAKRASVTMDASAPPSVDALLEAIGRTGYSANLESE